MEKYVHRKLGFDSTWFKRISENKAKTLNRMKIRVFMGTVDEPYLRPLIVSPGKYENVKLDFQKTFKISNKKRIAYWIPVAWYDRFNGEKVEPFDAVTGLEEYNRDFEF